MLLLSILVLGAVVFYSTVHYALYHLICFVGDRAVHFHHRLGLSHLYSNLLASISLTSPFAVFLFLAFVRSVCVYNYDTD